MEKWNANKDNADNRIFDRINFRFVMFLAPEFVTREQFPNAVGQVFVDFVNLRYVIESLILAVIIISFHLLNINRTSNTCN